jgi:diketogulonate reductase-like aldo/keto reductase
MELPEAQVAVLEALDATDATPVEQLADELDRKPETVTGAVFELAEAGLVEVVEREETDLELVAYSPLARGEVIGHPALEAVARKHDASAPQVALAWLRENGVTAIPKATSREHLAENFGVFDFCLSEEEMIKVFDS